MEKETLKTVSVVMCTYNGEAFIGEQLSSLMNQTYPIHELIIQDDGSTDQTLYIVKEFQHNYPDANIVIYQNPEQLGYNRNFFSAYLKATGDLIAGCDQDDIWEPHKIELLVEKIDNCSLIFHNSTLFKEKEELGKLHRKKLDEYPRPLHALLAPQSFGHQIMFTREALPLLRPFATYNLSYDYFMYTLCSSFGQIRYLDDSLVNWRRHDNATTYSGNRKQENKISGYYRAVCSLFNRSNRRTTHNYFKLCTHIAFHSKEAEAATLYMSKGDLWHIFKTCYLCLKHKHELVTDKSGTIQSLRAFFIPLFFIRDHGRYILKE